jgi:1,5-anhydro-D-fructose reductase (1,5-anhydro-D-mannitol-forming)
MALGWAVISTGLHVDQKIAPAINATSDAELVAICSRDQGRADACAQKHGAKAAYGDLGALLRDSRVDAVFIASPNALHAQHAPASTSSAKNR